MAKLSLSEAVKPKGKGKLRCIEIHLADGGWIVEKQWEWDGGNPPPSEQPKVFSEEQGAECIAYVMKEAGIPGAEEELTSEEKRMHAKK